MSPVCGKDWDLWKKNLPKGEGDCKVIVVLSKRKGSKSEPNKVKPIPEKDKHSQQVL